MLLQNMIQASPNDRLGLKDMKKEALVFNINCFKWSLYCGYIHFSLNNTSSYYGLQGYSLPSSH